MSVWTIGASALESWLLQSVLIVGLFSVGARQAALWMAIGSVLSFFGMVHTYTLTDNGFVVNVEVPAHGNLQTQFGCVYAAVAVLLMGLHFREREGLLSELASSVKRRIREQL